MFSFDAAKSLGNRRTLKARVSKAIPKVIQPLMLDGKCSPSNNEENTMTYIAAWVAFLDLLVVAEKVNVFVQNKTCASICKRNKRKQQKVQYLLFTYCDA